jgi:hypothetical protein
VLQYVAAASATFNCELLPEQTVLGVAVVEAIAGGVTDVPTQAQFASSTSLIVQALPSLQAEPIWPGVVGQLSSRSQTPSPSVSTVETVTVTDPVDEQPMASDTVTVYGVVAVMFEAIGFAKVASFRNVAGAQL